MSLKKPSSRVLFTSLLLMMCIFSYNIVFPVKATTWNIESSDQGNNSSNSFISGLYQDNINTQLPYSNKYIKMYPAVSANGFIITVFGDDGTYLGGITITLSNAGVSRICSFSMYPYNSTCILFAVVYTASPASSNHIYTAMGIVNCVSFVYHQATSTIDTTHPNLYSKTDNDTSALSNIIPYSGNYWVFNTFAYEYTAQTYYVTGFCYYKYAVSSNTITEYQKSYSSISEQPFLNVAYSYAFLDGIYMYVSANPSTSNQLKYYQFRLDTQSAPSQLCTEPTVNFSSSQNLHYLGAGLVINSTSYFLWFSWCYPSHATLPDLTRYYNTIQGISEYSTYPSPGTITNNIDRSNRFTSISIGTLSGFMTGYLTDKSHITIYYPESLSSIVEYKKYFVLSDWFNMGKTSFDTPIITPNVEDVPYSYTTDIVSWKYNYYCSFSYDVYSTSAWIYYSLTPPTQYTFTFAHYPNDSPYLSMNKAYRISGAIAIAGIGTQPNLPVSLQFVNLNSPSSNSIYYGVTDAYGNYSVTYTAPISGIWIVTMTLYDTHNNILASSGINLVWSTPLTSTYSASTIVNPIDWVSSSSSSITLGKSGLNIDDGPILLDNPIAQYNITFSLDTSTFNFKGDGGLLSVNWYDSSSDSTFANIQIYSALNNSIMTHIVIYNYNLFTSKRISHLNINDRANLITIYNNTKLLSTFTLTSHFDNGYIQFVGDSGFNSSDLVSYLTASYTIYNPSSTLNLNRKYTFTTHFLKDGAIDGGQQYLVWVNGVEQNNGIYQYTDIYGNAVLNETFASPLTMTIKYVLVNGANALYTYIYNTDFANNPTNTYIVANWSYSPNDSPPLNASKDYKFMIGFTLNGEALAGQQIILYINGVQQANTFVTNATGYITFIYNAPNQDETDTFKVTFTTGSLYNDFTSSQTYAYSSFSTNLFPTIGITSQQWQAIQIIFYVGLPTVLGGFIGAKLAKTPGALFGMVFFGILGTFIGYIVNVIPISVLFLLALAVIMGLLLVLKKA